MDLNVMITELLYLIKRVEAFMLNMINNMTGSSYESWEDFINSQKTEE